MTSVSQAAPGRNYSLQSVAGALETSKPSEHIPDLTNELTTGGRFVYRRTRRSPAFCNLVAALAGLAENQEAA